MTFDERVKALSLFGFTVRQAGFLTTVMLHSGVCLGRQYCVYAGIVRGQKMHDFFAALVANQFATVHPYSHRQTHVYHVHAKPLYAAIGERDNRHRKPVTLGRAMERLMVLDAVLMQRELTWLATADEKVGYFTRAAHVPFSELPQLAFGAAPQQVVRYFPDKLPIGVAPNGRAPVFVYVVTRDLPIDFRAFLQRHAALFRALPSWSLRLLIAPHLTGAQALYRAALREELGSPLRAATCDELRWYFQARRASLGDASLRSDPRYRRAQRAFGAPRFRRLYRSWREQGDRVIDGMVSPLLADAFARESAQVECHVLPHNYQHLSSLVDTA